MSMRAFIKSLTSNSKTPRRTWRSAFFARLSGEPLEDRRMLSFAPLVSYPVDLDPGAVVTGDFNADGRPDLAAANVSSNTVSVLLGNGDGTFQSASTSGTHNAQGLVAADLNGDGKTDLVTYNNFVFESDGELSVLLSNGDGTFPLPLALHLPSQFPPGYTGASALSQGVSSVALGDLNGDGKLDLVATGATFYDVLNGYGDYGEPVYVRVTHFYLNVLPGNGDGTFSSGNVYDEVYLGQVYLGDFNSDGRLDVVHDGGWDLTARLGNGDGTLQTAQLSYVAGASFGSPMDSNGDGNLDLLPALGNGDGTFSRGDAGAYGNVDVNADHKFDLLTVTNNPDENGMIWATTADVQLGRGDGTFSQPVTSVLATYTRDYFHGSLLADFDGNGFLDLAGPISDSLDNTPGFVAVSLNDGFWEEPPPPLPSMTIADVTVIEGNSGTRAASFTVSLSAASNQSVTVAYATANGTATAGSDYQAKSGTLTIPAGQTTGTIGVPVNGDRVGEPNETFFVNLSSATGAAITDDQGIGKIVDDEPRISINDVALKEGAANKTTAFTFTITLSAESTGDVTVNYATASGSATAGTDYVSKSGTVIFLPGETSKQITISVKGDKTKESNETFFVNLSSPSGGVIVDGQGLGTILNDDAMSTGAKQTASAAAFDAAISHWLHAHHKKRR